MPYILDQLQPPETINYQARVSFFAYIPALAYVALLLMPGRLTGLATTELALTDKRVIGKVGMFRRQTLDLQHKHIEVVIAQRGLIGMMFNYGTVMIKGRDGTKIKFRGIANPKRMEQEIDTAAEVAILGRKLPREDMIMVPPVTMEMLSTPPADKACPIEIQPVAEQPAAPKKPQDPNTW